MGRFHQAHPAASGAILRQHDEVAEPAAIDNGAVTVEFRADYTEQPRDLAAIPERDRGKSGLSKTTTTLRRQLPNQEFTILTEDVARPLVGAEKSHDSIDLGRVR